MDKNIPGIPHKSSPATTPNITIKGFILTCEPTIFGIKKLLSIRWIDTMVIAAYSACEASMVAKVIAVLITSAVNIPT